MKPRRYIASGFVLMFFLGMGLPMEARAQQENEDFTFEDVFSTRKKKDKVTFHGYAAFQFFDREGPGPGGNNTFDQHIFEPFFGYQVNDHVFAKIIVEFEHAPEKTDDNQYAEIFIEQAEIDITPWEGTTLAFGAILVPFGLENYFHSPSDNRLITRPPVVKSGANGNPILNNTWTDPGIQIIQNIPNTGTVDFYVINGSAVQTKDDRGRDTVGANANSGKSFGAELQVTEWVPGMNFGFSYVTGPHDADNDLESDRFGLHALINLGFAYVQGEYLFGTDEGLGTAGFDRDVSGYYVLASLAPTLPVIDDRLDLNVRYTDWTADDDAGKDFSELAFGTRIRIYKNTWIKAEYQINSENGNNVEIDNNQIGAQLSVLF